MTEILMSLYCEYGELINQTIRKLVADELGVKNDKKFYHLLRGTQQNLKHQGKIVNTGRGIWGVV